METDILVFLCKGLHVLALSSITFLFLYKLHGSAPENVIKSNYQKFTVVKGSSDITFELEEKNDRYHY